MVGSEARIRVSSSTLPSFIGTLKSTRMKTRLPERSRSLIERFGMYALVFGLWSLVFGLWSLVFGLWSLVFGLWSLVFEVPQPGGMRSVPPRGSGWVRSSNCRLPTAQIRGSHPPRHPQVVLTPCHQRQEL